MLTLIAARDGFTLEPTLLEAVRAAVRGGQPVALSDGEAYDIALPPDVDAQAFDFGAIRACIGADPVDMLLTPQENRRKRLLVADMDSTIVSSETLDELAAHAGIGEAVAAITRRSMNGEIDFETALRERVALLRGLEEAALDATWAETRLMPGARTLVATMRAHGAVTALVSGGFTWFTAKVAALCGFDAHHANRLLLQDGRLTGAVGEPILGRAAKLDRLQALAAAQGLQMDAALAVGDGANDLDMLRAAGLGIAYHAKPVVAAAVANRVDHADLRALLFAQGYHAREFKE